MVNWESAGLPCWYLVGGPISVCSAYFCCGVLSRDGCPCALRGGHKQAYLLLTSMLLSSSLPSHLGELTRNLVIEHSSPSFCCHGRIRLMYYIVAVSSLVFFCSTTFFSAFTRL